MFIPDPKKATKERAKISCKLLFVSIIFTKMKIILFLQCLRKKILANFQIIIERFTQKKLSISSQKYGFGIRDPGIKKAMDHGSRIPDPDPQHCSPIPRKNPEKTYPGSRGQKGTGSRIPDPDPQHCSPILRTVTKKCISF